MHGYDIFINDEKVGMGLSLGELNQWILETIHELSIEEQKVFKGDFGFTEGDFESFIYKEKMKLPLVLRFGEEYMVLDNSEFC